MLRISRSPYCWLALLVSVAFAASTLAQPSPSPEHPFPTVEKKLPAKTGEEPEWPNPYLSFLPAEAKTDWSYWNAKARSAAAERRLAMQSAGVGAALASAAETGTNNALGTADFLPDFGTAPGKDPAIDVFGNLALPTATPLVQSPEDEGSIPLATATGLAGGDAVRVDAVIGDGPFGSAASGGGFFSGDVDFYEIAGVAAGQVIRVDVDTPIPFFGLDSFVVLFDSSGNLLDFNDDDGFTFDSLLTFTAPAADDYYVSVAGIGTFTTANPFVSASGFGPGSEGAYAVTIGLDYFDSDFYSLELRQGDVFGANVLGAADTVTLVDPGGTVRIGSSQDASFIYADGSPLPGGGRAALAYVVEEAGAYTVRVDTSTTSGGYLLEVRGFRAPLESGGPGDVQRVFIDFDGATVNAAAILGIGRPNALLSPLTAFLPGWGLTAADEDAVIDAILAAVTENLSQDVRVKGLNGDFDATGIPGEFDIEILNSRDHADPFGQGDVSRVIVGGTIPQLGVGAIGIAESVDPGNFGTGETAFVLLDLLSAPFFNPNSLNSFPRAPGASIIDLIGVGVGNITAHEAGHLLGNFHTENEVTLPNIMDEGRNLPNTIGVGPDNVFGSADDVDVDFGVDVYFPEEGFTGIEDTLNTVAFGCPTPAAATVIIDGCDSGVPNLFLDDHTQISEAIGDCAAAAGNHGQFVSCVASFLVGLQQAGIISGAEHGAIQSCAAGSSIP